MNYYISKDGFLVTTDQEQEDLTQITDEQADEFSTYSATHTPSLDDGVLTWIEKEKTVDEQITDARNYLADTDYVANKLIEATYNSSDVDALAEKYTDILTARQEARELIASLSEISE